MSFCIFLSFVGIANVFWSAAIKGSTITASVAMAVLSTVEVASPKSPNGASDPNAKKVAKNKKGLGKLGNNASLSKKGGKHSHTGQDKDIRYDKYDDYDTIMDKY